MNRYFQFARLREANATRDLLELRFALEPRAAALAAARATTSDLTLVKLAVGKIQAADRDVDGLVGSDIAFHKAIAAATHNSFFVMMLDALAENLSEERRKGVRQGLRQGRVPGRTLREHAAIAAAITRRNPVLAEERMRQHLEYALAYFWS